MIKRELYLEKIMSLVDKDIIKVITGIRRCGKSYMFSLIKEELLKKDIPEENIIQINFENPKYKYVSNTRELDLLIENLLENINGRVYLFFDEIQIVDEWERSINGYRVAYDCDIYIAGSNSKLLSGELATLLTGRYMEIKMYPFSFKEFLNYKKELANDKSLKEYLTYGGLPFVLSLDNPQEKEDYLREN